MKNTYLTLLAVSCIAIYFGCSNMTESPSAIFIIPKENVNVNRDPFDDVEAKQYYYPYNFIADTGGHIFFYQQPVIYRTCGFVSWSDTISIPPFIDLRPINIIEIPSTNLEEFIKLNIINAEVWRREVSIASTLDSIQSTGLSKIFSILKDTAAHVKWKFRAATQEEKIVLEFKKNKKQYYSDEVKWDSTKILFMKTVEKMLKARLEKLDSFEQAIKKVKNYPITRDTLNKYPDSLIIAGNVVDYSSGYPCELTLACGTLKIKITAGNTLYKEPFIYVAVPCLNIIPDSLKNKNNWVLYKLPVADFSGYWNAVINKFDTQGQPFYTMTNRKR
jgi:hypothetical protein